MHTQTHSTNKYITLRSGLASCIFLDVTVASLNLSSPLDVTLLSELYFGEQLRLQTVEVQTKLHTGPQSVMLMKCLRINRGEERPTL